MNIKLSDAFRGRYALPIGGPCRVLFFMAQKKKNDKRKESERVENLPSPRGESFYICIVPTN